MSDGLLDVIVIQRAELGTGIALLASIVRGEALHERWFICVRKNSPSMPIPFRTRKWTARWSPRPHYEFGYYPAR